MFFSTVSVFLTIISVTLKFRFYTLIIGLAAMIVAGKFFFLFCVTGCIYHILLSMDKHESDIHDGYTEID
eukprot:gene12025-5424_t